ncbi:MAG: AAA family ATPase [Melioribacteraceae bacterium]|nr:AAA family ATPase [Melioribacteraceae bacterium]MCF8263590.1 AAA family ATPase [Melioribacteraceae bacterium]MCF8412417.1 AAA family ATPase [Melioribacteraceae bacterium]MCF8432189.1 AAA family ATPase [Melioribacteraceae bacterium]
MAILKAGKHIELKPEGLKWICDPEIFEDETTDKSKPLDEIVGQERAMKAIKMGVEIKSPGYNIFITGLSGTGKFTTVRKVLKTISPSCPTLNDYAYVNNFTDHDRPLLLTFPAGLAAKFSKDLSNSIKYLRENIPQLLENEPFITRRQKILNEFQSKQRKLMTDFEKKLKKDKLTLGQVKVDEIARPEILAIIDDEPVMIQQIDEYVKSKKITEKEAEKLTEKYSAYLDELKIVFKTGYKLSQEYQEKVLKLEQSAVNDLITVTFDELRKDYKSGEVSNYLADVINHIFDSLEIFKGNKPAKVSENDHSDFFKVYEVNIVLDNKSTKECPVIIETTPTYSNLFGTIEKYTDGSGGWYADFSRIRSGSVLRANGGYLVINAMDAFSEPGVWKSLKRVLLYGKLEIQDFGNALQFLPSVLKPEPIAVNTKIIMIGNNKIYSMLFGYEDDFNKIFKIKAEFDYEMKKSENAIRQYSNVIRNLVEKEDLIKFDKTAIARLVELGARYAGEKNKLTTRFAYIADLAREASFIAKDDGEKSVSAYHVNEADKSAKERYGLYETKSLEMIHEDVIMIDTEGSRVGQINGLAVYANGFFAFGKPTRITASVSLGNGNIINVERESGLSGNSHNKGMLIITGYFREKFGQKIPLSFNASIVFEQGYGNIDGDSASVAEICALISSLSGVPIKQSIAVTGSLNQKGDVQPIGGVNEKIEGFFEICKARKLNKNQGVIIPVQNVKDLMLKDDVVEAVRKKEFHIYPVITVDEAIEVLTGKNAGKLTQSGHYQLNTIYGQVEKKLKEMKNIIKPPAPGRKRKITKKK